MKLLTLFFFSIFFCSCSSPEKDIIGKWKNVKAVNNDQEVTQTNMIYESDFLANGKIVNYTNGVANKNELITYAIIKDTLQIILIKGVLDGVDTSIRKLHFSLNGVHLKTSIDQHSYSEYIREAK